MGHEYLAQEEIFLGTFQNSFESQHEHLSDALDRC